MKYLIVVLCLISTSCFAQETQQRIEITLGKLIIENATLASNVENLNKQVADLKKQLADKDKDKDKK